MAILCKYNSLNLPGSRHPRSQAPAWESQAPAPLVPRLPPGNDILGVPIYALLRLSTRWWAMPTLPLVYLMVGKVHYLWKREDEKSIPDALITHPLIKLVK